MKISAIDIRKHTFEKIFRGYDPDEVDAFMNSLSQEWERVSSENNLLKMQLEYSEKELAKLKDIESTLFRTLKAAEDTSRLIEKEANEKAEKRIEESQSTADALVAEAENRTNSVIQETEEKLRRFKEDFASEMKIQERDFRAIENFRENLIVQLSSLANSAMETVDRFEKKFDKESVLNRMDEIRKHVSEIEIPKKGVVAPPPAVHTPEPEPEADEEVTVILQDDKPDVFFEVVDHEPAAAEPVAEAEPELEEPVAETPVAETPAVAEPVEEEVVAETVAAEPEPAAFNGRSDKPKTAAEEAIEMLTETHRNAEKARDSASGFNRPRTPQESSQPKKTSTGGGGSFFDQI